MIKSKRLRTGSLVRFNIEEGMDEGTAKILESKPSDYESEPGYSRWQYRLKVLTGSNCKNHRSVKNNRLGPLWVNDYEIKLLKK